MSSGIDAGGLYSCCFLRSCGRNAAVLQVLRMKNADFPRRPACRSRGAPESPLKKLRMRAKSPLKKLRMKAKSPLKKLRARLKAHGLPPDGALSADTAKKQSALLTEKRGRCYNAPNFIDQSAAEAKYPAGRHPREQAAVRVPYEPSGEEPFQVQTQRLRPSRGGGRAARYPRRGLTEPGKRSKSGGTTERRPSS